MTGPDGQPSLSEQHQSYLYDKKMVCPACSQTVTVRTVKTSQLRLVDRDTDSMAIYQDINPLFYDVCLCNECGYAAPAKQFAQPLTPAQIAYVRDKISQHWNPKNYPDVYDLDIALERFKLALLSAMVRMANHSDIAMICLKMAWIYRSEHITDLETKFLNQARNEFKTAYGKEEFPIAGMDMHTFFYIMGELSRRVQDFKEANQWFGQVISDPAAKQALKDKTRDQKDLLKKEQDALGAKEE